MTDLSLGLIRRVGARILTGTICLLAAAVGCVSLFVVQAGDSRIAFGIAVALCAYPVMIVAQGRTDAEARMSLSITAVAMPSLLLFVCKGLPWQTDIHMVFFAALAMTTILCDWKALAAATVTVAIHHLVIGLLIPEWVFIGDGSLQRILFHAVVLLGEAGVLVWVAGSVVKLIELVSAREQQQQIMQATHDGDRRAQMDELESTVSVFGQSLSDLRQGDLTAEITIDFPPAFGELKANFNETLAELRTLIGSVADSAAAVRAGSGEIAQASENLARRTENSAAALEETTASITHVDGRLRASAAAASRTVERADQAIATVGGGRAVVDEAVQAMGRVSDSAKGIDGVIEGLDKIAFQTRVLAMNAAVEAGRAGDAGRGFAVVADLVSALAMRAEEEAKRARDQLTVTQTDIVTAVSAVHKVDGALTDISGDVTQVHELLATMAADNLAQSAAITEISTAIDKMDQATQQNAAMVEETSAAARNLASEVNSLSDQARRFKVGQNVGANRSRPAGKPDYVKTPAYALPIDASAISGARVMARAVDERSSV